MSKVLFYISLPFIYLLSILPFPLLYLLSDGMYILLFYVASYRKAVVLQNLRNSFPDKSEAEIKAICKKYYKYLADLFLEVFKTLTISKANMIRHCWFDPGTKQLVEKLAAENKSFIMVLGHLGNWEWAGNTFSLELPHQLYVIYHPLKNKQVNDLVYNMRTRFGTKLIAMKDTFREVLSKKNELFSPAFIADQTPSSAEKAYWTRFMNQDTAVFRGPAAIARKTGYPVVYASIKRIKRGYYELFGEMVTSDPAAMSEDEILELYTKKLERDIMAQPEVWLWSHRRWKHKKPETV